MKFVRIILFLSVSAMLLASCSDKKQESEKESNIWVAPEEEHKDIMSLEKRSYSETVTIDSEKYTYTFTFAPCDSLPVITNAEGQKYMDNTATLTIKRGDGIYFHQVFTRNTFREYSDYLDFEHCALIGFNYNYNKADEHKGLYFIATIGDPDPALELVSPVKIKILSGNKFSLQPAEDVETEPLEPGLRINPEQFD